MINVYNRVKRRRELITIKAIFDRTNVDFNCIHHFFPNPITESWSSDPELRDEVLIGKRHGKAFEENQYNVNGWSNVENRNGLTKTYGTLNF